MTRFPREPLDADERALAAALPRPHGRNEPDAALDARILAAAHAAAQTPAKVPHKRRWTVPLGLAASLCLALGLAWRTQLDVPQRAAAPSAQPEQAPPVATYGAPAQQADSAVAAQPMLKPEPAAAPAPPVAPPSAIAREVREAPPVVLEDAQPAPASAPMPAAAAAAPPPPAPPAPPPPIATAAAPRAMPIETGPPAARALAAPAMAAKARSTEPVERMLDLQADAPVEDVPPATADSPEVREAWLRRIGELMRKGKTDEARASLTEFRRRYPDATLPAELRPLEQPEP
ncbi:hypothetical protein H9L17_02720 [Thermomonas brevis]|uniref:Tetratricopeptide repeat protein n=1 Tax=Thermomonas brevis TaxID=215691 RepID=A0A7G9QUS0_9GAMM|nr:hypothetical protein [Thermomonas brevis]QNN47095.1 hypothetical protein H9L17_02720 [Thermomonas brevis]